MTSPLQRALETAKEIHSAHTDAELYAVKELSERSWGKLEGMSSKEMYAIEEREEKDPSFHPGNGIEARSEFQKRVLQGIIKAQSFHTHPLIIIGHGRVFIELCYHLGMPLIRQIPNCQILKIFPMSGGWKTNIIKD